MKVRADTDRCSDSAIRGYRASRKRACVPWRGVAIAPLVRSWSSYEYEIRASLSGDDGWVGMCASACETALLTGKIVTGTNSKYNGWACSLASTRIAALRNDDNSDANSGWNHFVLHCFTAILLRTWCRNFVVRKMCTANAAEKKFFASNIHEINHSRLACRNRSAITILCCGFFVLGCLAATEKTFHSHSLMECCFSPWPLRLRILTIS